MILLHRDFNRTQTNPDNHTLHDKFKIRLWLPHYPASNSETMKIHQLPYGARFEYKGEEYVKTGPMFGTGKNGQQLIPRSAVLKPIGEESAAHEERKEWVSKTEALKAFDAFYKACQMLVPVQQHAEMESLRNKFLASL